MKGLMEAGISDWGAIQAGLAACRASGKPFLPSVGEFTASCKLCVYERLGALETMQAYKHLLGYYATPLEHREPSRLNPFVYHLISQDGYDPFYFKSLETVDAVKYFSSSYKVVLDYAASGGELRKPVDKGMRIDDQNNYKGRSSLETAKSNLEAMRKMLKS